MDFSRCKFFQIFKYWVQKVSYFILKIPKKCSNKKKAQIST